MSTSSKEIAAPHITMKPQCYKTSVNEMQTIQREVYKQEIPYVIGFSVEGIEIWKQNQQIIKHISNEFLFWLHYIFYLLWEIDITLTQNEFVEVILTWYIDPISKFEENVKLTKKAIDDHFIVFYAIRYCTSGNLVDLLINKIFRN